ncbi:MAG: EAL domain-containing protein [Acidobacteriota bacterium]
MRVLIVVKDAVTRQSLEEFFRRRRHEITACTSPTSARYAMIRQPFDIALVDLGPDADQALQLIRELHSPTDSEAAAEQALVLALASSPEMIRQALEAGADDILAVPPTPADLRLRLAIGQRNRMWLKHSGKTATASQKRFRTLLETMREGVFEVDREGRIQLANSRMSRITGFATTELIGREADDILVAPEVRDKLPGQTLLGSDTRSEEYTIPLTTKTGDPIWVKLTAAPMAFADGTGTGSVGVVQDISEQRNAEESLRYREEYFRALLENASDMISILDLDGRILYQSLASERLLGHSAPNLIGQDFYQLMHEEDRERFKAALQETLQEAGATVTSQIRLRHSDAHWCTFESLCQNLSQNPVVGGIVVTSRDVTERRRVEAALQRERALFQQLFHNSPDGIVILDDNDRVVDANRGFARLFQFSVGELVGKTLTDMIVPPDLRPEAAKLSDVVYERRAIEHESIRQRKDGTTVDVAIVGYPIELAEGRTGAFGLYSDISERKKAERKLFHDAFHDALTGLPNRTLLIERLGRNLRRSQEHADFHFCLVFLDLDRFKEINDTLGHGAGDQLLIETAKRLRSCLQPDDTAARLAGDEFTMILEGVSSPDEATRCAERLLAELAKPFDLEGQPVEISGSIGLVLSSPNYERAEEIIRDADVAMYRAKARGRGGFEVFDEEMQRGDAERKRLEAELAVAIDNEQQVLHYQPIVSLESGRIIAFEALVRWRHPERGLLGPDELIPASETTGLIVPLGRWILAQAFQQVAAWRQQFPEHAALRISINISAKQLASPDFLTDLEATARESAAHPSAIAFELKESLLVDAPESMAILWQLRRQGYKILIDSFGRGYTSLQELYRSPIDTLKIDRTFVARMKPGGRDIEVVSAVSALGERLGLEVVAEGVETVEQLEQLRKLGLTQAQGFFFSEPLPSDRATDLLAQAPSW